MKLTHLLPAALLLSAAAALALAARSSTNPRPPSKIESDVVNQNWNQIKILAKPTTVSRADTASWLVNSMNQKNAFFLNLCDASELENRARAYVDKFGREGPNADLGWILANPPLLLPDGGKAIPSLAKWPDDQQKGESREGLRELQRVFCKAEVERFCADRTAFQRYYRAVIWSCRFLKNSEWQPSTLSATIANLRGSFPAATDEEYWFYARNFMILAHATGRDDLLESSEGRDYRSKFLIWREWLIGKDRAIEHLVPDGSRLTWRFDPKSSPPEIEPFGVPDRPFEDLSFALPPELQFSQLVDSWQDDENINQAKTEQLYIRIGSERIRRLAPP